MQPQLLVLLLFCVVLAAQGYYFGFVRPPKVLAWLPQSTFILMLFMMIPLVSFALWKQTEAVERLLTMGVKPHPSILYPVGLATGPSTWVFKAESTPIDIKSFYQLEGNLIGWKLMSSSDSMLVVSNGNKKATISMKQDADSTIIIYMILP